MSTSIPKDPDPESFLLPLGRWIREHRRARGWEHRQLAERLGTTWSNVIDWECGWELPTAKAKQSLADLFQVPLAEVEALADQSPLRPWPMSRCRSTDEGSPEPVAKAKRYHRPCGKRRKPVKN